MLIFKWLTLNPLLDIINDKPMSWTKQKTDRVINGEFVYKTRESSLSQIYPVAKIIGDVSSSDSQIFVDDPDLFTYNLSAPYQFGSLLVDGKEMNFISLSLKYLINLLLL